jgi:riboflavin biosynthesis pyrimidine reductase
MHRIWPLGEVGVLDDHGLEQLYRYPAGKWLAVNFVSSADGAVEVFGRAAGLSDPPDRRVLQLGSDLADVVLVGARTAMIEEFCGVHPDQNTLRRRAKHELSAVATTAVITTGRSLPADAPVIVEAQVPTVVITTASAPEALRAEWSARGARVLIAGRQTVDLAAAVKQLAEWGLGRIDCEGGSQLFGALLAAGVVDELRLTVSPLLVAGAAERIASGAGIDPVSLELASVLAEQDTLLLRYLLKPGQPTG